MEKPTLRITTPRAVAVWPRLGKPDTKFVAEGEFSIRGKFDPSDEKVADFLAKIEDMREKAMEWARAELENKVATSSGSAKGQAKRKLETLAMADTPIKPEYDDDGNETGMVIINFKQQASGTRKKDGKPWKIDYIECVDGKKNKIDPRKVMVGGGSIVKIACEMRAYYNAKDNVAGVTFKLRAVQILKLVEFGNGADYFDEEEDGEDLSSLNERELPNRNEDDDFGTESDDEDDADF